jgi:hypothetical protein
MCRKAEIVLAWLLIAALDPKRKCESQTPAVLSAGFQAFRKPQVWIFWRMFLRAVNVQ